MIEAGLGFGFLGMVIGYLPTIYSSFSRREIEISLLDARAGSPPTAAELLARFGNCPQQAVLDQIFRDWERWAAEVLESHLSYPALSFFRSQHNNQSWLGALTTILDGSALVMAGVDGLRDEQAKITFAMARHAMVDLAQVVNARYNPGRTRPAAGRGIGSAAAEPGRTWRETARGRRVRGKAVHLRSLYESYAVAIAAESLYHIAAVDPSREAERQLAGRSLGPRHTGPKSGREGAARWTIIFRSSFQLSALSFQSRPLRL